NSATPAPATIKTISCGSAQSCTARKNGRSNTRCGVFSARSRMTCCIWENPNLANIPHTAATTPVTNHTIHRLPPDPISKAIKNTIPASTSNTGHKVISWVAKTVCSAVSMLTGGMEVLIVSFGSSCMLEAEPVASATASLISETATSATGSRCHCNWASVELSAIGSPASISSCNESISSPHPVRVCSKLWAQASSTSSLEVTCCAADDTAELTASSSTATSIDSDAILPSASGTAALSWSAASPEPKMS